MLNDLNSWLPFSPLILPVYDGFYLKGEKFESFIQPIWEFRVCMKKHFNKNNLK